MNDEEYDYFKNHDLTVFGFAAQAKGFFPKFLAGGKDALSPKAYARYYNEETVRRFQRLESLSREHNCSITAAVLAVLCNNRDFDTVPIIGCKSTEHLEDSLSGGDLVFTQEETDFIYGR